MGTDNKKNETKNIIIILGNGFDLAHNFKTSYNDFAKWFVSIINEEIRNFVLKKKQSKILNEDFKNYYNKSPYKLYLGVDEDTLINWLKIIFMEGIISYKVNLFTIYKIGLHMANLIISFHFTLDFSIFYHFIFHNF